MDQIFEKYWKITAPKKLKRLYSTQHKLTKRFPINKVISIKIKVKYEITKI